ncbi:MAG: TonB-dependent receptor [Parvibaculum sp.]
MSLQKKIVKTTVLMSATLSVASMLSAMAAERAPEIVVTATRTEVATSQVGSSISVLTSEEIEKRQYSFTVDALRSIPGVTISQNGAFGGAATVRIRGAASDQTLVLIDGVIVNDPASPGAGFNFASLDPNDIERIEVLRGPQSTLYGSQAIGGVVNIITKRADTPFAYSAFVEAGSYNTVRSGGTVLGKEGNTDYRVSLSGIRSSGISKADENQGNREEDGYRGYTVGGNVGHNLTEAFRLEADVRYAENRSEFDAFGGVGGDGDRVGYTRELQTSATAHLSTFDGLLENQLTASHAFIDRDDEANGVRNFSATGSRTALEYLGAITPSDMWNVIVGAKTEEAEIKGGQSLRTDSVFTQVQVLPVEQLSLIGGVRYDDHETAGGVTTFRFTGAYDVVETGTIFRASWGEGFKSPTPFQLTFACCGALGPNTGLKPEESRGWDAGIEQQFFGDRLNLQVNYFQQDITNQITFQAGRYENIAQVEADGWEFVATARPVDWLDVSGNFTHQTAKDKITEQRLARVPVNLASLHVTTYPTEDLSVGASVTYNGRETEVFGALDNEDWTRVDLRSAYQVSETVELFGRVENLFDQKYQDISGYGTPGLSGFVGVRVKG